VRLDEFIRVQKIEMQLFGHQPADRRLARAHKTYEGKVDDMAPIEHGDDLAEFRLARTPISSQLQALAVQTGTIAK
jgi:hypothetical protein